MFAIVQNETIVQLIQEGTPFTLDGNQYPANWCNLSTTEDKAAIGMVNVIYSQRPDDVYYWVTENEPKLVNNQVTVDYTATPKDLDMLKKSAIEQINNQAYSMLVPTDYMDSRKANDPSYVAPADWITWRASIRSEAATAKINITGSTDVPSLIASSKVVWAKSPDQPN